MFPSSDSIEGVGVWGVFANILMRTTERRSDKSFIVGEDAPTQHRYRVLLVL